VSRVDVGVRRYSYSPAVRAQQSGGAVSGSRSRPWTMGKTQGWDQGLPGSVVKSLCCPSGADCVGAPASRRMRPEIVV
jgi:hypothetical protein